MTTGAEDGEPWTDEDQVAWEQDCLRFRGRVLTGKGRHWCEDWDGLPVDDTTPEWPCICFERPKGRVQ